MITIIRIVALGAQRLCFQAPPSAQQYPTKPVKIVLPFPPAGVTGIVGRLLAQKLSEKLGQQFYIENIAGTDVAKSRHGPDRAIGRRGYYDPVRVIEHRREPEPLQQGSVRHRQRFHPCHQGRRDAPAHGRSIRLFRRETMTDLIDLFKKEPGKYSVGSPGAGTTPSLSIEMLKLARAQFRRRAVLRRRADGFNRCWAATHADGMQRHRQCNVPDQGGRDQGARDHQQKRVEFAPDLPTLDELGIRARRPRP